MNHINNYFNKCFNENYIDGIYINFHQLGYFSRKSTLKRAMKLKKKFDFLITDFGYYCYAIDIPGIFDITILSYRKDNYPELHVTLEREYLDVTMDIENEKKSVPLIFYAYNHDQAIRCSVNNSHYVEDYTKYLLYYS